MIRMYEQAVAEIEGWSEGQLTLVAQQSILILLYLARTRSPLKHCFDISRRKSEAETSVPRRLMRGVGATWFLPLRVVSPLWWMAQRAIIVGPINDVHLTSRLPSSFVVVS